MRRFLPLILSLVLVICSVSFSFASSWVNGEGSAVLPSAPSSVSFPSSNSDQQSQFYVNVATHSNSSPVYYYFLINTGLPSQIVFWSYDSAVIDFTYTDNAGTTNSLSFTTNYDATNRVYFGNRGFWSLDSYVYSPSVSSASIAESLGFVVNSSPVPDNSILTVLTSLVNGCIVWVTSMAIAVKDNGLLLFFVLTIFVGVGIGLFNRFRKE